MEQFEMFKTQQLEMYTCEGFSLGKHLQQIEIPFCEDATAGNVQNTVYLSVYLSTSSSSDIPSTSILDSCTPLLCLSIFPRQPLLFIPNHILFLFIYYFFNFIIQSHSFDLLSSASFKTCMYVTTFPFVASCTPVQSMVQDATAGNVMTQGIADKTTGNIH